MMIKNIPSITDKGPLIRTRPGSWPILLKRLSEIEGRLHHLVITYGEERLFLSAEVCQEDAPVAILSMPRRQGEEHQAKEVMRQQAQHMLSELEGREKLSRAQKKIEIRSRSKAGTWKTVLR